MHPKQLNCCFYYRGPGKMSMMISLLFLVHFHMSLRVEVKLQAIERDARRGLESMVIRTEDIHATRSCPEPPWTLIIHRRRQRRRAILLL